MHGHCHSHARPCSYLYGHAHGHVNVRARFCRDQRTAHTDQAPTQFTQVPCGCVTPPRIYASNRPTQNAWGAWVWRQRRRRRCDVLTSGGPALHVIVRPEGRTCSRAIGPRGPITVKPKGLTDLKARQPATAYQRRVVCTAILPVLKAPANKRAQSKPAACGLCLTRTSIQPACQQAGTVNEASRMTCTCLTPVSNPPSCRAAGSTICRAWARQQQAGTSNNVNANDGACTTRIAE